MELLDEEMANSNARHARREELQQNKNKASFTHRDIERLLEALNTRRRIRRFDEHDCLNSFVII